MDTNQIQVVSDTASLPAYKALELLVSGQAKNQKDACEMVGISPDTFQRAVRKYPEFNALYKEYRDKLAGSIQSYLEEFHHAEEELVKDLLTTISEEGNMQTRVMAYNKLREILMQQSYTPPSPGVPQGNEDNEAAMLLAKNIRGAKLSNKVSKITVEFRQQKEAMDLDESVIDADFEKEPEEPN